MDEQTLRDPLGGRRYFLKGIAGVAIGIALLGAGALERLIRFFQGPRMTPRQESAILARILEEHKQEAQIEALQIERLRSPYLPVARMSELSTGAGVYFYDYRMRPALAFLGKDGLPLLISAKCTHLGCTVGNTVDAHNRILCPCHLSLFDIETGRPSQGPAIEPLPHLGWVLKDAAGQIIASRSPAGVATGKPDASKANTYTVFMARQFESERAS